MQNCRKWLVLSFFTDIDGLACSQHVDDRLISLREHGIEPIVISSACSPKSTDYLKRRTHCFAPSGLRFELRYSTMRRFPSKTVRKIVQIPGLIVLLPAYLLESIAYRMDSTWSWWLTAYRAAVKEARANDVELIYSTGGPSSAHLAACLTAQQTGLPWIAEYQDPIVGPWINRSAAEVSFHRNLEERVARNADGIVFMTKTALAEGEKRNPSQGKGHLIRPGAVRPGIGPRQVRRQELVLGHFGSLSGNRDIVPVLKAMTLLVESVPSARERFRLLVMGSVGSRQESALRAYPYPDMIEMSGKRSRQESLVAMSNCDMLLLLQDCSEVSAVTIPSKVYEYMLSAVPILGLTYDNPELDGMLLELGHSVAGARDAAAIAEILRDAFAKWSAGLPIYPSVFPVPYSTEQAAGQLIDIADDILRTREHKRGQACG